MLRRSSDRNSLGAFLLTIFGANATSPVSDSGRSGLGRQRWSSPQTHHPSQRWPEQPLASRLNPWIAPPTCRILRLDLQVEFLEFDDDQCVA